MVHRILLRVDLNINPAKAEEHQRFREAVESIRKESRQGRIILLSHRGRPEGREKTFSLKPFTPLLEKHLRQAVAFIPDPFKPSTWENVKERIILVENLRFWKGEEEKSEAFAEALAELGDEYILDAFSVMHRDHASITLLPKLLPSRLGMHAERDIRMLSSVFNPRHPFILILGGAKLRTKLPLITRFIEKAEYILIGGAMFFTFLASLGKPVGENPIEEEFIPTVKKLLQQHGKKILIPRDGIGEEGVIPLENGTYTRVFDIGPETRQQWKRVLRGARTIVWNGPLGRVEEEQYQQGTRDIALSIPSKWRCTSILGGGDTLEALARLNIQPRRYTYTTSAGGAFLTYLAQGTLPGLEAIKTASEEKHA